MSEALGPDQRDRRQRDGDRRRRVRDRRGGRLPFRPGGWLGRAVRWFTGPWTSANGLSWLRVLVLFLLVWWGALTIYSIPTSSMEPTLQGNPDFWKGDRVAVNKLAFGPRLPFSTTRLLGTGTPKRWDIVVFDSPAPLNEDDVMIKRVAGLPGDHVRLSGGVLYINGKAAAPPADIADRLNYTGALQLSKVELRRRLVELAEHRRIPIDLPERPREEIDRLWLDVLALHEKMAGVDSRALGPRELRELTSEVSDSTLDIIEEWWRRKIRVYGASRYGILESEDYTLVPAGHYYCLGDNGPDSYDSRMFGWVPQENLIGRAFAIVTPLSRVQDLSGFSETARGMAIFLGAVLLVILWEVVPGFFVFSWKVWGDIAALGLERGDHVLVDRVSYGLRLPLTSRRIVWWREPQPGDVVCYSLSGRRGSLDFYFGEVREVEGSPEARYVVRGPGENEDRWFALGREDVVGRARAVWWPLARRRGLTRVGLG